MKWLHDSFDMIVLPGGQPGSNHLKADARVLELVKTTAQQGRYVAAICAAPMVLATAGLLDGKQATCYPGSLNGFASIHLKSAAVVEDGNLITSRGPGTAMDFALTLVERLAGPAKRQEVEAGLVALSCACCSGIIPPQSPHCCCNSQHARSCCSACACPDFGSRR